LTDFVGCQGGLQLNETGHKGCELEAKPDDPQAVEALLRSRPLTLRRLMRQRHTYLDKNGVGIACKYLKH
jgi:hypothetical protein